MKRFFFGKRFVVAAMASRFGGSGLCGASGCTADQPAAQLSYSLRLSWADSLFLATARAQQGLLYMMDTDFRGLSDVELFEKQP